MRACIAYRAAFTAGAAFALGGLAMLSGCSFNSFTRRGEPAAWRAEVDARCLSSGEIKASAFTQAMPPLDGPSACGIPHPFRVSGTMDGRVAITPPATIDCAMTATLNRWISGPVQQAAYRNFGQPVVALHEIASYSCRSRDNKFGAKISEHAFGNAIDIAGFKLANGQWLTVAGGWSGGPKAERAFLREAFAGACGMFDTALGPGEPYHGNHFHLDLLITNAMHGRHYCNPRPGPFRGYRRYDRTPMALGPASDITGSLPGAD
jgi:hypothetical protein